MNLNLPAGFRLERVEGRLQLAREDQATGPVWIDLTEGGRTLVQLRRKLARANPLFRGLGSLKETKTVWDLTAGFGQDAFYIALMGYTVKAVEQSPVLFALLQDAVERAMQIPEYQDFLQSRLEFCNADSRLLLSEAKSIPDAVYLDPMYPDKKKSALPRKEMRWLREIVGEDETGLDLLQLARQRRIPRILVKRPLKGEALSEGATHSFKGQSTRYDLYLG